MNLYSYLLYLYQTKIQDVLKNIHIECDQQFESLKLSDNIVTLIGATIIAILLSIPVYLVLSDYRKGRYKFFIPIVFVIMLKVTLLGLDIFQMEYNKEKKECVASKTQTAKDSIKSNTEKIKSIYNQNIELFDNYKTDNIDEIIKKIKEKDQLYTQEVENKMKEIKKLAIEKNVFIDDEEKIKPFVELYVMNKNHIPINGKVEQKISPEETGKVCAALEIENCFENSSFIEYNKDKKEREEELARMSKPKDYTSEILITGLLIYFFTR